MSLTRIVLPWLSQADQVAELLSPSGIGETKAKGLLTALMNRV